MRTTLNLDEDVAARVGALARESGRSLSRVVNELVRTGLRIAQMPERSIPYEPPVFDSGRPLVDVTVVATALELLDRA